MSDGCPTLVLTKDDIEMSIESGWIEEQYAGIEIKLPLRAGQWIGKKCIIDASDKALLVSVVGAEGEARLGTSELIDAIIGAMNFDVKNFAFAFANHVVSPHIRDEIKCREDTNWTDWILDRVELALHEIKELDVLRARCVRAREAAENTPTPHRLGRDDIKEKKEFS